MTSRRGLLVVAAALTFLLGWVVALPPLPGRAGEILLGFSDDHGVHYSDLPAIVAWLVGMVACGALWRRR